MNLENCGQLELFKMCKQLLWKHPTTTHKSINIFTITAEILARSLANFYCQWADRHMNYNLRDVSTSESGQLDNLVS